MDETVDIPYESLSPEALLGVLEAFVLREGTDYGSQDAAFADKVAQVRRQLERGEAKIVFAPAEETCLLVPAKTR